MTLITSLTKTKAEDIKKKVPVNVACIIVFHMHSYSIINFSILLGCSNKLASGLEKYAVFLLYFTSSVYLMEVKMHKALGGQQVSL